MRKYEIGDTVHMYVNMLTYVNTCMHARKKKKRKKRKERRKEGKNERREKERVAHR